MTAPEVAAYSRRHVDTVRLALRREELRGNQSDVNCNWRIHRDDVDAWVRGGTKRRHRRTA
ncbi:MAG: helix-turn-helix domain-containing protein [Sciscionella sp.]